MNGTPSTDPAMKSKVSNGKPGNSFGLSRFSWRALRLRLLSLDGDPHRIALAFAVGTFISFTPFYGLHTFIAIAVAYILKLNLTALMIGAWLNNPFISLYVYSFCYWIGFKIIGGATFDFSADNWQSVFKLSMTDFVLQISLGCLIVSLLGSVIAYVSAKKMISRRRRVK